MVAKDLAAPFVAMLSPAQRIWPGYLLVAVVLAYAIYRRAGGARSLTGFFRYCFPRDIYRHASTRVDLGFFLVNAFAAGFLVLPIVFGSPVVAGWTGNALATGFGPLSTASEPSIPGMVLYSLSILLAIDFATFSAHYLQHRVPVLWEFHKVHHSAGVLTPLTVYRKHPVDDLLGGTFIALTTGVVHGVFGYLTGGAIAEPTIHGLNFGFFLFYLLGYNLRHTHVWLAYPKWLSHFLISPAQHQIHHSCEVRHLDRNLGFIFAFWDWIAGTLYVPKEPETFELGLTGGEHVEFDSVWKLYALPFSKVTQRFWRAAA